jgi:hypothetical protein
MSQEVDYLDEDKLLPKDQKFVCLSFLTDKENKTTLSGLKVRGVFADYKEACDFAKKLQSYDKAFHVYVGEMGKWLPFDPDPDSKSAGDAEYGNKELNKMMKKYQENREKANELHEFRKNDLMDKNKKDNLKESKSNLLSLTERLEKENDEDSKKVLLANIENVKNEIKGLEKEEKELENLEKELLEDGSKDIDV